MKQVKLLRDAKILHKAGEVVTVSPAEFNHLVSLGSATPYAPKASADAKEPKAEPVKKTRLKK